MEVKRGLSQPRSCLKVGAYDPIRLYYTAQWAKTKSQFTRTLHAMPL